MLIIRVLGAVALAAALGGCATVTRGTTNQISISSEPGGAEARSSLGHACTATPCTWEVSRRSEFVVTFSKEGYADMQVPVSTRIAGAGAAGFAGNILIGGLVGMGVDAATGSTLEHFPNPVLASLVPLKKAGSHGRGKHKPGVRRGPAPRIATDEAPQS
ncbi:translation initiation factor 2 [uncultured Bosea sp.]|uniref:translation initiation factor 2 n=1 Tax=uncultured Bosea sp. TaxID=211457 RepID=UPI00263B2C4A|nr:translation initiation factor 2 [uncultured Bosea sp.]